MKDDMVYSTLSNTLTVSAGNRL